MIMKRLIILIITTIFCSSVVASAQDKGYYGSLEASGGYIYKFMPGAETAPQDFMLGVSYVGDIEQGYLILSWHEGKEEKSAQLIAHKVV